MNRVIKSFGMVLVLNLVSLLPASFGQYSQAKAAEVQCLDAPFSATGKPSSIGELARANAFFTWKSLVKDKFGSNYNAWSAATERKLVCIDLMNGENKGKWECTRTAKPCKVVKSAVVTEKGPACKDEAMVGWGARRGKLSLARAEAQSGWKLKVIDAHGDEWAEWLKAKNKSIKCSRKTKWTYQCIAQANACRP